MSLVWKNEDALTFEVGAGAGRRFVKWAPPSSSLDLAAECERMRWAFAYARVPRVLGCGQDADGAWLITAPLGGENAVSPRWRADPVRAVTAIGMGLRLLHESLPVAECPFSWSAEERVTRLQAGVSDPAQWEEVHRHLSPDEALRRVAVPAPVDRLVVCHGDACSPNTVIAASGEFAGHVDLALLGVADRWADLAIATLATTWNYGPGFGEQLLDAYGIEPDEERTRYYRLLWDLEP